ncbi:MAG: YcnI family protein [Geminicoccaceae bacterium]
MFRPLVAAAFGAVVAAPHMLAAHVTLESREAAPDASYKAVLRVGHGCEGKSTTAIRVQIPEGVIAVKPMPKPGWQVDTVKDKYDRPYDYFGSELTEGVRQVAWTGGELRDDFYDEFVFVGRLTGFEPGTVLHFPTVQECAEGVHRWIEIPAAGQDPDELDEPAPQLTIIKGPS